MNNEHSFSILVTKEQRNKVIQLANEQGISIAECVRRLINEKNINTSRKAEQ